MKSRLTLATLVISSILLLGCTKEIPVELPIFEKADCKEAHRTKLENITVISTSILDANGGVSMTDLKRHKDKTWLIVPAGVQDEIYMDILFLYTKRNALNLTDCIRWERNRGDKYESFNIESNKLRE